MSRTNQPARRQENSLMFAQTSCLCLGLGLALWGIAPLIAAKLLTGKLPETALLALNALVLLSGVVFIGLPVLIGQRRRWAAWAGFTFAAILTTGGFIVIGFSGGGGLYSGFMLLLTGWTSFACWLAIGALSNDAGADRDIGTAGS